MTLTQKTTINLAKTKNYLKSLEGKQRWEGSFGKEA